MIKLIRPHLEPENIAQHVTCVRPKRFGGARIEREQLEEKVVIHNYGHGGFGWSLLPGSVMHAIALFEQNQTQIKSKITVIGAGCMGLLTAILLKEKGWEVEIIADQTQELASHKAAGSMAVIAIKASRDNQDLMDQVAVDSYVFYRKLGYKGIKPLPAYMIHEGTPDYRYPLITAGVMEKPEDIMIQFDNGVSYKAKKFNTFFLDTTELMQEFMDKILAYNIPITNKKIIDFSKINSHIIFNCSGLGARVWDKKILPVQGHLVRLKNQPPETLKYIIYAHIKIDNRLQEISWTPNIGGTLGGSVVNGEDRLDINPEQSQAILKRARIFFNGR